MSVNGGGSYLIRNAGGTSASAPLWAGIIALDDQYAGCRLGFVNPAIYRIGHGAHYRRLQRESRPERRRVFESSALDPTGIRTVVGTAWSRRRTILNPAEIPQWRHRSLPG